MLHLHSPGGRGSPFRHNAGKFPTGSLQLLGRAGLNDAGVIHHDHLVGDADHGRPVGDDDRGVIGTDLVQGGDDRPLVLGIQGRRGFVDKQHVGGFGQAAGNAHTLPLTAGQLRAQLPHRSVPPVRQPRHHGCQLRFLGEPICRHW